MAEKNDSITEATREAERREAQAAHGAPQVPTAAEAEAADRNGAADPATRAHYEDMAERGANQKGEGRIP